MSFNKKFFTTGGIVASSAAAGVTNTDNFSPVTYTGNGSTQSITSLDFQPDLVWVKSRVGNYWHRIQDSVRGAGNGKSLSSNGSISEGTYDGDGYIDSLDANGFTVAGGASSALQTNGSNVDYVAWCWKAADTTTTIAANTVGNTIASDVRANQDAGFSIVEYDGTGANATVGHGLSSAPELIFIKRTDASSSWSVYTPLGSNYIMFLNATDAAYSGSSTWWNNTDPTSSVFTIGTYNVHNVSNSTTIAYCFHSVDGYQKIGSYNGDSGSDNQIDLGFQPRFLMVKLSSHSGQNWYIMDDLRENTSVEKALSANTSDSEDSLSNHLDFTSTGFTLTKSSGAFNQSGYTYIYLAIA